MDHTKIFDDSNKLLKAGGIIVRNHKGTNEVLLISSADRSWSFPKGHLEHDETLEEGAIRECKEETGLVPKIIKKLPNLEYQNAQTKDHIIVHFYLMTPVGGELTKESKDIKFRWEPIGTAPRVFDYQNLRDYIQLVSKNIEESLIP